MKWFLDDDWTWNGLRQPYRVLERHPDLVFIEPHLQVICYQRHCHPTWWKNYHDANVSHLSPPPGQRPLDWRNDTFAIHFCYPIRIHSKTLRNCWKARTCTLRWAEWFSKRQIWLITFSSSLLTLWVVEKPDSMLWHTNGRPLHDVTVLGIWLIWISVRRTKRYRVWHWLRLTSVRYLMVHSFVHSFLAQLIRHVSPTFILRSWVIMFYLVKNYATIMKS